MSTCFFVIEQVVLPAPVVAESDSFMSHRPYLRVWINSPAKKNLFSTLPENMTFQNVSILTHNRVNPMLSTIRKPFLPNQCTILF